MTAARSDLMALRERLADEITLYSVDKSMLLELIDDRLAASQPDREARTGIYIASKTKHADRSTGRPAGARMTPKPDTGGHGEGRMTKAQRSILELAVSRGGTIHVFPDQISVVARLEAREWMHSNGSHLDRESTITDAGRAALSAKD